MFKGRINVFVLIVHFLNHNWEPFHVTIKLFETVDIFRHAMALKVNQVLWMHGLNPKIIAYVKDEGNNLWIMTIALTSIVFYEVLKLLKPFIENCWGHAMLECCQYITNDTKAFVSLTSISIKKCLIFCKRQITWTRKSGKGWQEWQKACLETSIHPCKFIPRNIQILKYHCLMLWMTTIYGISRVCSKFASLANSPNCL
jgi:hypothetical protein